MTARVLQVVLSLNPGGTERLVVELARRLHRTVPMAVCCLDEPGAWAADLQMEGVPVTALSRSPGFRPGLGRRIAVLARAHQTTVIHAHHYSPFVYSAVARLSGIRSRVLFTEHGRLSDAGPSSRRRAANVVLRQAATRVFAVSEDVRQHLLAEGFRSSDVQVIYNGVDMHPAFSLTDRGRVRNMLGLSDDVFAVGTIARLDPVKDLGTLIDAVARLAAERHVRLFIVGDGPEMPRLKQLAAARGVAALVTFLGYQKIAIDFLAGFDAYANSSTSEGVSLTVLEAMAAERPVVATAVGGTPEVVDDQCGRLVPARNPVALANALRMLADDSDLRQTLGRAARRRVQAKFTLDRMIEEYRSVYESSRS